jgi:isopenicillin N synthase-like dioxygenase
MATVPVIDVQRFTTGDASDQRAVGEAVNLACTEIGFFQVIGHGVPADVIDAAYRTAVEFFDLSDQAKAAAGQPAKDIARGWSAIGKEGLSYSLDAETPGDLKEKFDVGPPDVPTDDEYFSGVAAAGHFAANVWPGAPADLREAAEAYHREMARLARDLMRMFALGLDLDRDHFDTTIDRAISILRFINYPDQATDPLPGQLRAGAHTDYGSLTIVRQEDRPGGLQVMDKGGEWLDVPVVPGALVINIGDLMAEWTNDRWVSTLHRVVNPPREQAHDSRRISLVFFHQPNYDAVVECLPTCLGPGEQPKHAPITSGDHLYSKFVKQTTFGTGR